MPNSGVTEFQLPTQDPVLLFRTEIHLVSCVGWCRGNDTSPRKQGLVLTCASCSHAPQTISITTRVAEKNPSLVCMWPITKIESIDFFKTIVMSNQDVRSYSLVHSHLKRFCLSPISNFPLGYESVKRDLLFCQKK